ncbi:MAG: hypothetical protein M3Z75_31850 [Actinomycetota bacterium]|nr:hypothetical protein [Actinomycetota bacterium]
MTIVRLCAAWFYRGTRAGVASWRRFQGEQGELGLHPAEVAAQVTVL